MNNETEKFINDALRMGRELVHAGAKATAREGATDESTFAMDAGSALLRLVYMAVKLDATVIEQAEMNVEQAQEIARLNTRLQDMADESNRAAKREFELDTQLEFELDTQLERAGEWKDSIEEILDDAERQRDAYKAERDDALHRLERTRRDINALIEKYS